MIETFDKITQEVLKDLEKTQRDFWNISRQTAEFLYKIIIFGFLFRSSIYILHLNICRVNSFFVVFILHFHYKTIT